jgi:hypothetical protein
VSKLTAVSRWHANRIRFSKKILRNDASELVLFCSAKNAHEYDGHWVRLATRDGPGQISHFLNARVYTLFSVDTEKVLPTYKNIK